MRKGKFLFVFFFLLILSGLSYGREITLKEAVDWGLSHNPELKELAYSIEKTERALKKIEAGDDWHLDVSANYGKDKNDLSLELKKVFTDSLSLKFKVFLKGDEADLVHGDLFGNSTLKKEATILVNDRLYPILPSNNKKNYISTYYSLLKLNAKFVWEREQKKIEFIEKYLKALRLYEYYKVSLAACELAKKARDETKRLYDMREVGIEDLYDKEINLKNVEYLLEKRKIEFDKAKEEFYMLLGLPSSFAISFEAPDPYIERLKRGVPSSFDIDVILRRLEDLSPDLVSYRLDKKLKEKELKWVKDKKKPEIDLNISYELFSKDFGIYLSLTYNLIDGGEHSLEVRDKERELVKTEEDYNETLKKIESNLLYLNKVISLDRLKIEEKKLAYEKEKHATARIEEGVRDKIFTATDHENAIRKMKEAYIDLESAYDTLLIDTLKLLQYGGYKIK